MNETMLERVARAICEASGQQWRTGSYRMGLGPGMDASPLNEDWRHKARAAIQAMRDPTDIMVATGLAAMEGFENDSYRQYMCWRAMIDVARASS